jgi:hypothetical protein
MCENTFCKKHNNQHGKNYNIDNTYNIPYMTCLKCNKVLSILESINHESCVNKYHSPCISNKEYIIK